MMLFGLQTKLMNVRQSYIHLLILIVLSLGTQATSIMLTKLES